MTKGITAPCSECRDILIRYANLPSNGDFEMICAKCGAHVKVIVTTKTHITVKKIAVILLMLALPLGGYCLARHFPNTIAIIE